VTPCVDEKSHFEQGCRVIKIKKPNLAVSGFKKVKLSKREKSPISKKICQNN
jgi:hypothetical protein